MKIEVKNQVPEYALLLRSEREIQNIHQDVLAKKIGVSAMQLSFLERGERRPRIDTLERWCDELGFEVIIKKK